MVSGQIDKIDPESVTLIPYPYSRRHNVLFSHVEEGVAKILQVEPVEIPVVAELRRRIGKPLEFADVSKSDFEELIRVAYDKGESQATRIAEDMEEDVDLDQLAEEVQDTTDLLEQDDDAPIKKFINVLLGQAIREKASDIHFEAFESSSVVRFRIDGILKDLATPRRELHSAIVSRLKIMADLDIAEKRKPQDGRFSVRLGDHPVDLRVSSLPTRHGERIVLRILDKKASLMDLNVLMKPDIRDRMRELISVPHGVVLVTGPTGSGKTTTLYAALREIDRSRLNVMTIEDPVEYDLEGVGQMQVNAKIDLSFADGLRSILRQDPDVVLVGEIRDSETAEIAIQASLTGHLVLSTLHTNTAIGAITRLRDMGVEEFLLASTIRGVLAQRLVRTLCPQCREKVSADKGVLQLFDKITGQGVEAVWQPRGCNACNYTGYSGRAAIYELILIDRDMERMIHENASEQKMLKHARKFWPGLEANGLEMVRSGETSVDEVLRVTRDVANAEPVFEKM